MVKHYLIGLATLCVLATSCGEKTPLPTDIREGDGGRLTDTTFIPILPHWTGANGIPFNYPFGVSIGYDQMIYVCDTRNDRIVRLTRAGEFVESFSIPHPHGVAQDRAFTLAAVTGSISVWIKRPEMSEFEQYAKADSTLRCKVQPNGDTFCIWDTPNFASIAATRLTKSVFYTVGAGRLMVMFGDRYQPEPRLYPIVDSAVGYGSLYSPNDVEFVTIRDKSRLVVSQFGSALGVQYLDLNEYQPVFPDQNRDISRMPLMDVKYLASDERGNIFVLHRAHALVMMFDKDGRFVLSFGLHGTDTLELNDPTGIAVQDDIVLIADAKNNRIVRYQLTAVPQN